MPRTLRGSAAGRTVALLVVGWAVGLVPATRADDLRPSWECLPADTAVMVRLPQAAKFVEAMRSRTKFGAIALRPDRLEGMWRLLVDQAGEAGARVGDTVLSSTPGGWEKSLEKYGLTLADFGAAFAGDVGGGLVVRRREGDLPPLAMMLAWVEPGEEVAGRMMAAVKQRLEEVGDGEPDAPAARRIDVELAGHEVISVVTPVMALDLDEIEADTSAGEVDGDEADADRELARLEDRLRAAKPVQTGQQHVFYATVGGRMLYGTTFPGAAAAGGGPADFDAVSGGDEAQRIFGGFLAAHARDDEPALARVLREPALAAAAVQGVPLVEAVFVPRAMAAQEPEAEATARLAQVGLDDVGGIVWRQAFADGCWQSTIAVTLPTPRHGMLAMLDQRCDACDVPPFVTREAVDFTQISLDLGAAFRTVREVLGGDASAEQLTNMLNVADVQATTWLGADVATMLTGLGSRHWILSFPPRIAAAMAEARAAPEGDANSPFDMPAADALAMVWEVADEAPILKLLGQLAPLAGGELKEEQGFRGLRLPGEIAVSVGRRHLVLAVGAGTLEQVLTSIRNPPAGDVSWRESDVLRRARGLLDLPPARMFAVGDATATGGMLGSLREFVAALEPSDVEEDSRELLAAGQKLLPTADEMKGMFGVSASVLRMTDDGVVLESAWELPAP
jgi:hypothetical protein